MSEIETTNTSSSTSGTNSSGMTVVRTTTADDLLEMYDEIDNQNKESIDSEATKQAKIQEEVPKKLLSNKLAKQLSSDINATKQEENHESTEEGRPESDQESGEEKQKEVDNSTPKAVKAKLGDQELDIPEDAVVPVELPSGKVAEVSVKEAIKAFAGQEDFNRKMDQRISYVARREKEYEGEITRVNSSLAQLTDLAAQGDMVKAFSVMAQMAGKDPVEYQRELMGPIMKVVEAYTQMTPEQRELYFAKQKIEYLGKKQQEGEAQIQQTQAREQMSQAISAAVKEMGVSIDDFRGYYETLKESGVFEDPSKITIETVKEYHYDVQHQIKVDEAVTLVNPDLAKDQELIDNVYKLTRGESDLSVQDLADIVRAAVQQIPSRTVENLNQKVRKQQQAGFRAQSNQASSNNKKEQEVDEEMYDFFFSNRKVR